MNFSKLPWFTFITPAGDHIFVKNFTFLSSIIAILSHYHRVKIFKNRRLWPLNANSNSAQHKIHTTTLKAAIIWSQVTEILLKFACCLSSLWEQSFRCGYFDCLHETFVDWLSALFSLINLNTRYGEKSTNH